MSNHRNATTHRPVITAALVTVATLVMLLSGSGAASGQQSVTLRQVGAGELRSPNGGGRWQGFRPGPAPAERAAAGSDITPSDYARARAALAEYERTYRRLPALRTDIPNRYPFYPQAGKHESDLFFTNFADLDPAGGAGAIVDWDCTGYTYDTHHGTDSGVRSFAFQDVGVPIYAALDGRVIDTDDGNPDRNTALIDKPANYVMIDHGDGQTGLYWHMRRNSVAVRKGDSVVAGQTIGMTASSGFSTGPHLHFETWEDGEWLEPFTGKCNPGTSGYTKQLKFKRKTYLWDAGITHEDLAKLPTKKLPPEQLPSSGQFQTDDEFLNIWFWVGNLPESSSMKLVFRRPNRSVAFDTGVFDMGNTDFLSATWWTQQWLANDMRTITGDWTVELHINRKKLATLPFTVLTKRDPKKNGAPAALKKVKFRRKPKAGVVPFCEISHSLILDDPDYDVVSYRYVWTVNNTVVRDVTIAAHADALAVDQFAKGDRLECTVTPSDGDLEAASKTVGSKVK